jgi:hypothetical protein
MRSLSPVELATVDAATGIQAIQGLQALATETMLYLERTLPEVSRKIQTVNRRASYAQQVQAFRQMRGAIAPIVEHLLTFGEGTVQRAEMAFAAEEIVPLGEEIWSTAFLMLDRARRNFEFCAYLRKTKRESSAAKVLWTDEWERRYESIIDAFDDYSETIALGLDPDTRREIEASLATIARA